MKAPYLLVVLLNLVLLASCENDDICSNHELTPRLIIRFKNQNNPQQNKTVPNLLVLGKNKNEAILLQSTDSIALPLTQVSKTSTFLLIKNAQLNQNGALLSGEEALLEVSFSTHEEFASKSCGYRTVYEKITATPNPNSWISNLTLLKTELYNENTAIITIHH